MRERVPLLEHDADYFVARDQFASKPGVIYEDDELVAIASEEVAIRSVDGDAAHCLSVLRGPGELQRPSFAW